MKSIKSRYSLSNVESGRYQSITLSGDTTFIDNKINGDGYVFVPYVLKDAIPIIDMGYDWRKEFLKKQRIEKLNKLKNGIDIDKNL